MAAQAANDPNGSNGMSVEWLTAVLPNVSRCMLLFALCSNNFSNEMCLFLTGKPIPSYITGLPAEALATPFGQMLRPMIAQMEGQMRGSDGGGGAFGQPWGGDSLSLPRGIDHLRADRMVDPASNPSVPHNAMESAAALAAQAIDQPSAINAAPGWRWPR